MARPLNIELQTSIRQYYADLCADHPLSRGGGKLKQMVATKFNISIRTVWYYLQVNDDQRRRYTAEELVYLRTATRKEIFAWAKENGRNPASVYAAARRVRVEVAGKDKYADTHKKDLTTQGFFDFGNAYDLKIYDFKPMNVRNAKTTLAKTMLTLDSPNYLVQPAKHRYYTLSTSEQVAILTDPEKFLRGRVHHIAANWQNSVSSIYVVLDVRTKPDVSYVVSTHISMGEASKVQQQLKRLAQHLFINIKTLPADINRVFKPGDVFQETQSVHTYKPIEINLPEGVELNQDLPVKSAPLEPKEYTWTFHSSLEPDPIPLRFTSLDVASAMFGSDLKGWKPQNTIELFEKITSLGGTLTVTCEDGSVITAPQIDEDDEYPTMEEVEALR